MARDTTPKAPLTAKQLREDRLKAALKANMARRKAQTRARTAQKSDTNGGNDPMKGE